MHLHIGRTMDGPSIKTVPVMSRIFGVSSSTRLGIEGYLTCWKDELGNHTLGTKAQNMHQLRVFGAKKQALYFLPLVPMLWHSAESSNPGTLPWSTQTHE